MQLLHTACPIYGVLANTTFYKVTKVIDGDTIQVQIGRKKEKVRLIGIDTPESVHPTKPVQCFGREASKKAKELLLKKKVKLEADPTNSNKDKYGRLLRYVYLEDGLFVNEYLVKEGYAHAYIKFPFQYKERFKADQQEASDAGKGLWSVCEKKLELKQEAVKIESPISTNPAPVTVPVPPPSSPAPTMQTQEPINQQCLIKGNISSTGERIYHVVGGAYYSRTDIDESKGERWFCSEAEAIASGWRKSQR